MQRWRKEARAVLPRRRWAACQQSHRHRAPRARRRSRDAVAPHDEGPESARDARGRSARPSRRVRARREEPLGQRDLIGLADEDASCVGASVSPVTDWFRGVCRRGFASREDDALRVAVENSCSSLWKTTGECGQVFCRPTTPSVERRWHWISDLSEIFCTNTYSQQCFARVPRKTEGGLTAKTHRLLNVA
jgi:hypothetical protein